METSVKVDGQLKIPDMWIDQEHIDGILALIYWGEGFEKAGNGNIPGRYELIMHYRILKEAVNKAKYEKTRSETKNE